jgi:hypothetical protein
MKKPEDVKRNNILKPVQQIGLVDKPALGQELFCFGPHRGVVVHAVVVA